MKQVRCAICGTIHQDLWCPKCGSVVSFEIKKKKDEKKDTRNY